MRRGFGSALIGLCLFATIPATAATPEATGCESEPVPSHRIEYCTRVLQSGRYGGAEAAWLYRNRGSAYLIEGDVDGRAARVLTQGAECPSLSPDHLRIAFKKRVGGSHGWWQLSLFDLSTRAVRTLSGDTESVDDQVEWLDTAKLIYFRPASDGNVIWQLRTDVDGPPQPFVRAGFSPAMTTRRSGRRCGGSLTSRLPTRRRPRSWSVSGAAIRRMSVLGLSRPSPPAPGRRSRSSVRAIADAWTSSAVPAARRTPKSCATHPTSNLASRRPPSS